MMRLRQIAEVARQTFVQLGRHRLVRLLALLAPLIALGLFALPDRLLSDRVGDDLFGPPLYMLGFQFAVPTLITYLGLTVLRAEIADRSVVHVFVQPIHRSSLLTGRWLAVTVFGALATAASCALYWAVLSLLDAPWRRGLGPTGGTLAAFVAAAALAAPGYAAVGMLCGAVFRRPLIAALWFVVGWEVIVSNVPPQAGVRGWTVADPVRRFLLERADPPLGSELSDVLQASLRGGGTDGLGDPLESIAWFTGIVLVIAVLMYSRREYDARAKEQ